MLCEFRENPRQPRVSWGDIGSRHSLIAPYHRDKLLTRHVCQKAGGLDEVMFPEEAIKSQLAKIIASPGFAGSEKLRSFLSLIVLHRVQNPEKSLKEYEIGIAIFGKLESFDPKLDGTVRQAAIRLRKQLGEYYATQGAHDRLLITVPKGHYVPEFTLNPAWREVLVRPSVPARKIWNSRRLSIAVALAIAIAIGLILALSKGFSPSKETQSTSLPRRLLSGSTSEGQAPIRVDVGYPIGSLAITPDGRKLYVLDTGHNVTVLSMNDLKVQARLELPYAALSSVMSPDGRHLYIGSMDKAVMVLDTSTDRLSPEIIEADGPVFDLAITPDGQKLYVAMSQSGFSRITLTNNESKIISAVACPVGLAIDHQGRQLLVSYQCKGIGGSAGHDALEIYDLASEQSVSFIRNLPMVGSHPMIAARDDVFLLNSQDACRTPTYDHVGCPKVPGDAYHLIRAADRSVLWSLPPPDNAMGAAFSPDGSRIVFVGRTLTVFDWARRLVVESLPLPGERYWGILFTPKGDRVILSPVPPATNLLVLNTDGGKCVSAPRGLINLYSGDGTLNDSNSAMTLISDGRPQFAPALMGHGFRFSPTTPLLQTEVRGDCTFCGDEWTISFFVKFDSIDGEMTLINKEGDDDIRGLRIFKRNDRRIVFRGNPPAKRTFAIPSLDSVRPGIWYHVVAVAKQDSRLFYLNGVLQGEALIAKAHSGKDQVTFLGNDPAGGTPLSGLMDEIAWYDRALLDGEIRNLVQAAAKTCLP